MAAETNLITRNQMAKVREIDFVEQFTHSSLAKLIEVLGVTRKIPMIEGTTMYVYKTTGTLQSGVVDEGDIIPLSQYQTEKTPVGTIALNKWRKAVSAEAIMKSGYNAAVGETDRALLGDVQKGVRGKFFDFINSGVVSTTTATGAGLQAALASAWGQLQVKFEDDTAQAVYFVNPLYRGLFTLSTSPLTISQMHKNAALILAKIYKKATLLFCSVAFFMGLFSLQLKTLDNSTQRWKHQFLQVLQWKTLCRRFVHPSCEVRQALYCIRLPCRG